MLDIPQKKVIFISRKREENKMTTQTHKIENTYCAQAAIALTTGEDVDRINEIIREREGTNIMDVMQTLERLGYGFRHEDTKDRDYKDYTLTTFSKTYNTGSYIVALNGHYVAVKDGQVADNTFYFASTFGPITQKGRSKVNDALEIIEGQTGLIADTIKRAA